MKRVRAEVEITRRTHIEFEVDDDADPEAIKETALEEAELAEWDDLSDELNTAVKENFRLKKGGA